MPVSNDDIWWHIRAGEFIFKNHQIPAKDIFSFTAADKPFTNGTEWLSEIGFYLTQLYLGWRGIILLKAALAATSVLLTFLSCRLMTKNTNLAFLWCAVSATIAQIAYSERTHLYTLVLLALTFYLLLLYRTGKRNLLILVPLVMVFWANLHRGYLIGLFLLGLFVIDELARYLRSSPRPPLPRSQAGFMIGIWGASVLATLVNPLFYQGLTNSLAATTNPGFYKWMIEWQSPDFHNPFFWPYALTLPVAIALFAWNKRKIELLDFLLFAAFFTLGLSAIRHIPIYALVAAPILTKLSSQMAEDYLSEKWQRRLLPRIRGTSLTSALNWLILAVVGFMIWHSFNLSSGLIDQRFPAQAVQYIKERTVSGQMYNYQPWGGYVIYYLWPEHKDFIDGRADMFLPDVTPQYFEVWKVERNWRDILKKYDIGLIVIPPDNALSTRLRDESSEWGLAYEDSKAVVFVRI